MKNQIIGKKILYYETIDSTNEEIRRQAEKEIIPGLTIYANQQTKGKGRLGRSFVSTAGKGLYVSVLLTPKGNLAQISQITAWSAVALANAIEKTCQIRPKIKWPNDLLLYNKKLTGILTEMVWDHQNNRPGFIILGMGTNLHFMPEDFDEEVRTKATSLAQILGADKVPTQEVLLQAMLEELDQMNTDFPDNPTPYLEQYRADCVNLGKEARILSSTGERVGQVIELNDDFSLKIRFEDGSIEDVNSGEVSVRGIEGYV